MPELPLDELVVREGRLFHRAASLPETEHLVTGAVAVQAKAQLVELAGDDVSYQFALNEAPDAAWSELFAANRDGLVAEIQGAQLELRCEPEELERSYAKAKDLLARTNRDYAGAKARIIERVAAHEVEQRRAQRDSDERSRALRAQFERLVL